MNEHCQGRASRTDVATTVRLFPAAVDAPKRALRLDRDEARELLLALYYAGSPDESADALLERIAALYHSFPAAPAEGEPSAPCTDVVSCALLRRRSVTSVAGRGRVMVSRRKRVTSACRRRTGNIGRRCRRA
jgi:hypothetical protein